MTNQRRHWCLKLIMLFWSWLTALQQWLCFILHQERAGLHNCEQKRMQSYPLTCMVTRRYVSCMIYGCSPFYDYLAVILPLIEYTINYYSQVNMCSSTSQWQYGQVTLDARAPLWYSVYRGVKYLDNYSSLFHTYLLNFINLIACRSIGKL